MMSDLVSIVVIPRAFRIPAHQSPCGRSCVKRRGRAARCARPVSQTRNKKNDGSARAKPSSVRYERTVGIQLTSSGCLSSKPRRSGRNTATSASKRLRHRPTNDRATSDGDDVHRANAGGAANADGLDDGPNGGLRDVRGSGCGARDVRNDGRHGDAHRNDDRRDDGHPCGGRDDLLRDVRHAGAPLPITASRAPRSSRTRKPDCES